MKITVVATTLCALLCGSGALSAQTAGSGTAKPIGPTTVRITTRAPDPDKWIALRSVNGAQRIFRCKVLACPDAEVVSFIFSKSPTRHPDPKALEKFAKVDLPKSIRAIDAAREILTDGAEKVETMTSKTATVKGYPAVVNESKFTSGKSAAYSELTIIFAGPAMIRVQSSSQNRDLAQKSLDQFIEVMRIEEGPSPASPSQKGAQEL